MLREFKFALCVAAVSCAALSGFAEWTPISDDFNAATVGETPTGWSEGGVVKNEAPIALLDEKYLYVEGTTTRTNNSDEISGASRTLDFWMYAEEFEEFDGEGQFPEADGTEQFRLAFDANTNLCLRCTPRNAVEAGWVVVYTNEIPAGTWVRVTMKIDYSDPNSDSKAMAQLSINGDPCSTPDGYKSADTNQVAEAKGPWYQAAVTGEQRLTAVDFEGIGGVDSFVLRATPASATELPGANEPDPVTGVEPGWLMDNDIASSQLDETTSGGTGYTYKQAHDAGINPTDATPLYVTDVTISSSASNKMQIAVNGTKGSYTIKRSTSLDMTSATPETKDFVEGRAWVNLPSDSITETTAYFYEVAATSGSVATTNKFGLVAVVNSSPNVIISVPWVEVGSGIAGATESKLTIDKLICTKNLSVGDKIYCYTNGVYTAWTFNGTAWDPMSTVNGETVNQVSASEYEVARGDGIQLERSDRTKPFYLYGQYSVSSVSKIIGAGKMALLANPNPSGEYDFSGVEPSSNNDKIIKLNGGVDIFTYDSGWGHPETTTETVTTTGAPWGDSATVGTTTFIKTNNWVKVGEGFWYKNNSSERATTIDLIK